MLCIYSLVEQITSQFLPMFDSVLGRYSRMNKHKKFNECVHENILTGDKCSEKIKAECCVKEVEEILN